MAFFFGGGESRKVVFIRLACEAREIQFSPSYFFSEPLKLLLLAMGLGLGSAWV